MHGKPWKFFDFYWYDSTNLVIFCNCSAMMARSVIVFRFILTTSRKSFEDIFLDRRPLGKSVRQTLNWDSSRREEESARQPDESSWELERHFQRKIGRAGGSAPIKKIQAVNNPWQQIWLDWIAELLKDIHIGHLGCIQHLTFCWKTHSRLWNAWPQTGHAWADPQVLTRKDP